MADNKTQKTGASVDGFLSAVEHPRRVFFLPKLPLGGTSKIDRRELAARAARKAGNAG